MNTEHVLWGGTPKIFMGMHGRICQQLQTSRLSRWQQLLSLGSEWLPRIKMNDKDMLSNNYLHKIYIPGSM